MNINGQEVDIKDLYDNKYMHKEIKNERNSSFFHPLLDYIFPDMYSVQ